MGDIIFYCPLCCRKGFDSKKSLIEHLSCIAFACPVCCTKFTSIERLVEHLNCDTCETRTTTVEFSDKIELQNNQINGSIEKAENVLDTTVNKNEIEANMTAATIKFPSDNNVEVNKMYMELLSKQLSKPCLQTQELKLVLEDGESRYVVLTQNDSVENLCTDNAVVTKQNNDGTISLTTVKGDKPVLDQSLTADNDTPKAESEENALEIYSCNTCGVSFSSVIDHIQNFHNDQDVVVEEPLDETPSENPLPIKSEITEKIETLGRGVTNERLPLRRMITETGDIVETPVVLKDATDPLSQNPYELALVDPDRIEEPSKSELVDKQGDMTKAKASGQKNKISNGALKNANDEEKSGLYHKVVLQELVTTTGNKVKIYNCISCNLFVPTLAEFKSRPCMISNKYTCPHCPVSYENHKSLCAHMKIHKSKETVFDSLIKVDLECATCGTVFPTRKSLKLHKRMHDPIKSRPIEPPVQTNEGQVASEDKFLCGICNKLIPMDYRVIHQNSHNNTNKINCHICNKKFNSQEYLDMHMSVHNTDKVVVGKQDKSLPYICMFCNRQFARPHEKVKHERIHTGEKPHSCEICGKSFRVSYCLTLHMRTHTGARPYTCPHCGKRFKAHSVYNHHLLTHSEVRAYKCPFCPKAFKTSVQLAGHKNSHTKPFSCQQCNRPFASLYAVRVHMDSHQKQNSLKFSCSLCGASYARAFALKDHVRQVHQADMDAADAADALSGLKEEEWLVGDDEKESEQPLHRDINQEINELDMNADELIIS